MSGEIKQIGNWKKEIEEPWKQALSASMEVCGRTMAEACKHAIILMAKSAAAMTKKAPKNRKIESDPRVRGIGGNFVRVFKKDGTEAKLYRLQFENKEEWNKAKLIFNAGLAKKSWMWGLKNLAPMEVKTKPITGVAYTKTIKSAEYGGYIMINALKYLLKILPAGWLSEVTRRASEQIMYQAKLKIVRDFYNNIRREPLAGVAIGRGIGQYFLRG